MCRPCEAAFTRWHFWYIAFAPFRIVISGVEVPAGVTAVPSGLPPELVSAAINHAQLQRGRYIEHQRERATEWCEGGHGPL